MCHPSIMLITNQRQIMSLEASNPDFQVSQTENTGFPRNALLVAFPITS